MVLQSTKKKGLLWRHPAAAFRVSENSLPPRGKKSLKWFACDAVFRHIKDYITSNKIASWRINVDASKLSGNSQWSKSAKITWKKSQWDDNFGAKIQLHFIAHFVCEIVCIHFQMVCYFFDSLFLHFLLCVYFLTAYCLHFQLFVYCLTAVCLLFRNKRFLGIFRIFSSDMKVVLVAK